MEIRLLGRNELRYHKCPFTYGQFKVKIYIAVFMTTALQGYLGGGGEGGGEESWNQLQGARLR